MTKPLRALLEDAGIRYQKQIALSQKTTIRVGGPAEYYIETTDTVEIANTVRIAKETGTPLTLIGNGSNLLIQDGGIPGIVLSVRSTTAPIENEGSILHVPAGASLMRTALYAQEAGLGGLAKLSGIPGAIGGAICMNAGAYGAEISQYIRSVDVLEQDGTLCRYERDALAFGYRTSCFMRRHCIITSAEIALSPEDPTRIAEEMRALTKMRRDKQPIDMPSAGSFFKRPLNHYAAALIEQAGLKGFCVGGAQVSAKHAGFFVNNGGATAEDFLKLMALVQEQVFAKSGVTLEPEVRILGCALSC